MKYKILIALLFGNAAASSLCLLLNIHSVVMSGVAGVLLTPGGVLASFFFHTSDATPALAVLASNALVYSAAVFVVLVILPSSMSLATMRLVAIRLVAPTFVLLFLACIPAFNPLWSRGIDQLSKKENELRETFPVGMGLDQARALLRSRGIDFREQTETSETIILKQEDTSIIAQAEDLVMLARLETDASEFPCGYDIEVILLFGRDQRLKSQYVHHLRICP